MENGSVVEGTATFLYSSEPCNSNRIKAEGIFESWDFSNTDETKELRLTQRYNAEMAGFTSLFNLYNDDLIIRLVDKIKEKAKNETIADSRTLDDLATEIRPTYKRQDILSQIHNDSRYAAVYCKIKDFKWSEISAKCKINKESLLAFKFNGTKRKYEANSSRDRILHRLDDLNEVLELYEAENYNEFLRKTKFVICNHDDKIRLKNAIEHISVSGDKTIGNILDYAEKTGLLKADELFDKFVQDKGYYLWERIRKITFNEYRNSIAYLKSYSPLATQHSVKGSEYDNVLVILESEWNKYDFRTIFGKGSANESVRLRTRKLFYVCVTRAKRNLVVYMPTDDVDIIKKAKCMFGEKNVIQIV